MGAPITMQERFRVSSRSRNHRAVTHTVSRSSVWSRPRLSVILAMALFIILWIAGGASRPDVLGQTVVRTGAWLLLVVTILVNDRPVFGVTRPVLLIIASAIIVVSLQLLPLPPNVWQAIPGRAVFAQAAAVSSQAQPWRPISTSPGATINALSSLIIPSAILVLIVDFRESERAALPAVLLGLAASSMLIGILQLAGTTLDNPLINESALQVSGNFANRNHFALFLAIGCLIAPVWATLDGRRSGWRGPLALGLMLLFVLMILASGSRAGLVLGLMALVLGPVIAKRGILNALNGYPRWTFRVLIVSIVCIFAIFVLTSIASNRAVSIERLFWADEGQDMRSRGLPTVLAMIKSYFPIGTGFGTFDPMFRLNEPFSLLKPTYFNHAHNDFLEVVLDGGLPGGLLLACGLSWWIWASARAWQAGAHMGHAIPKLGSAILLLIVVASAFDYPSRTPVIMAVAVVAGIWLSGFKGRGAQGAFTSDASRPITDGSPGNSGTPPAHA